MLLFVSLALAGLPPTATQRWKPGGTTRRESPEPWLLSLESLELRSWKRHADVLAQMLAPPARQLPALELVGNSLRRNGSRNLPLPEELLARTPRPEAKIPEFPHAMITAGSGSGEWGGMSLVDPEYRFVVYVTDDGSVHLSPLYSNEELQGRLRAEAGCIPAADRQEYLGASAEQAAEAEARCGAGENPR